MIILQVPITITVDRSQPIDMQQHLTGQVASHKVHDPVPPAASCQRAPAAPSLQKKAIMHREAYEVSNTPATANQPLQP